MFFPHFPTPSSFESLSTHSVVLLMNLHQPLLVMNWFYWFMELWLGSLTLPGPIRRGIPAETKTHCRSPPLQLHVDLVHALITSWCTAFTSSLLVFDEHQDHLDHLDVLSFQLVHRIPE
ncbi:hypothetical protein AMECASPLE_021948, partial [Ameca splendens]